MHIHKRYRQTVKIEYDVDQRKLLALLIIVGASERNNQNITPGNLTAKTVALMYTVPGKHDHQFGEAVRMLHHRFLTAFPSDCQRQSGYLFCRGIRPVQVFFKFQSFYHIYQSPR